MVGLGCLLRDGDPRAAPRMARDSDGYTDAGGPDRLRRHPRGRFVAGDVDWRPRLLHVPHRPTAPQRGRVHTDRPQAERAVPCEPFVAGGIFRRDRGRDARRIPAAEPGRLRHPGTHPSARPRRDPHPGRMLVGRLGRLLDDRLRRLDALQRHEDDLALLRPPDESVRDPAARVLPFQQRAGRVAVRRSGPADKRGRGPRERDSRPRDGDATGGDPGRRVPRRGGHRAVRLRNLLGPEDGPGALSMATDLQLKSQPQRGRVLPAWAYIGWRWVWRSPAAAIVPLLQPFFFLYFLHLIAPESYFPLQVAGAMLFSTQNIGSWCLSDSAVFRIELRLQDIFVASPHDKLHYLFGVAFSNLIPAAPALIALAVILAMVTHVTVVGWIVLVACILTVWVLYSAIGIAVSSRLRSQREVWPVGNLIFTLLGILSPLYYPLSKLPPVWRELAQLLPATYAALLVQGTLGLDPSAAGNLAVDAGLLVLSTAGGLLLAWRLYQWRER